VELLLHLPADGLHLRSAETGAKHEIFGEGSEAAEVEHGDAGGFFVLHGRNRETYGGRKLFQIHLYKPCLRMYFSTRPEKSPGIAWPLCAPRRMSRAGTSVERFSTRQTE